jgi:hypothetical protein
VARVECWVVRRVVPWRNDRVVGDVEFAIVKDMR